MTLLFVTNSLYGGGSEKILVQLANSMSRNGHKVFLISYTKGKEDLLDKNIKLYFLKSSSNMLSIGRIRKLIKLIKPQTVISFEYSVNICVCLASIGFHIKVIISERNDPKRVGGSLLKRNIRNFCYLFSNVLVCQTDDAKAYFPKSIRKKTVVIMNPVSGDLPIHDNKKERRKEIVNFCRFHKQKNLPLLIDAFDLFSAYRSDYVLIIYGNGPEKNKLISYANSKKSRDRILIKNASKQIHTLVVDSAMFVSSSDYEGLSNSMLEAMAIGLPTIVTDCPCGGARMVITNNINGILVPVGDAKALCDSMLKIANQQAFANALSQKAIEIRERLSLNIIVSKWEELI